jgi:hypothetical protein
MPIKTELNFSPKLRLSLLKALIILRIAFIDIANEPKVEAAAVIRSIPVTKCVGSNCDKV